MINPEISNEEFIIADFNQRRIKLAELMGESYNDWLITCDEKINDKYSQKEKRDYKLWHLLVGGGLVPEAPNFDFEDDLSILKMLADKEKEYA
jgi:hypothetical protein